MDDEKKKVFDDKAIENILRGVFLATDLYDAMRRVNGSSRWRELELQLNHVVSYKCIRLHIQSIPDFTYQASHVYPMLDSQAEARRLYWMCYFWVSWKSAKRWQQISK